MIKNWQKNSKLCLVLLLLLPLLAACDGGGVTQFFIGLLVGTGKWVSQTVVGPLIENTIDYLVSFLDPNSTKPDYWGALTGTHPPLEWKATKEGISYTCLSPNPTKMVRDSIQSTWKLAPEVKEFVVNCTRKLFGIENI